MKKLLQLTAFLVFSANAIAQPVILNGDNMAPVGLSVPVQFATTNVIGTGGSNQTWDFSSLSFTSIGSVEVIAPASSPIGTSFSTANYALSLTGQDSYSFFEVSGDKMEVLAWTISTPGEGNDYSPNPRTVLKFPFNYLDSENDTWQKVGGSVNDVTITYEGYGTLITPTQTYYDAIRVKEDYGDNEIDYQWYILNPLMAVAIYDHNLNRLYHFGAAQSTGTGDEIMPNAISVYPNPTKGIINFSVRTNVQLTTMTGQVVANMSNVNNLDMSNVPAGIYFASFSDEKGQVLQRSKIVKD